MKTFYNKLINSNEQDFRDLCLMTIYKQSIFLNQLKCEKKWKGKNLNIHSMNNTTRKQKDVINPRSIIPLGIYQGD